MDNTAGKVMLLAGIRRYFIAISAGVIGSFAMPPSDLFIASFISFTLLIWLLDGISSGTGRVYSIGRVLSSFVVGWSFGIGYFIAGLWWIKDILIEQNSVVLPSWGIILLFVSIPIFFAIFYGIATSLSSFLWYDGVGRICIIACSFGLCEWLRSWFMGGGTWGSIGYAAMPVPVMMQSVHWIGLFGMNSLSVFCFSSPALFGTRQGMKVGVSISSILLTLHVVYGAWRLGNDSDLSQKDEKKMPVIRMVQPGINFKTKEKPEKILERYLSLTSLPVDLGQIDPSIIIWADVSPFLDIVDSPQTLNRISGVLKKGQLLIFGSTRMERVTSNGQNNFYKSIYVLDSNGKIVTSSNTKHTLPFFEYLPYKKFLGELNFDLLHFLIDYLSSPNKSVLSLSEDVNIHPRIFSEILSNHDIDNNRSSTNAIVNLTYDYWLKNNFGGAYQIFRHSRVQAVEVGLPLIRVENNGISAFFDSRGQLIASLNIDRSAAIDIHLQSTVRNTIHSEIRMKNFWIIEFILLILAVIVV
ncbi:MAG: apolipoprotein N-acyltransferase [Candidatus Liberibacter europaeus]|uniref:Apolipoprotein N-acyltransferase n=1 Tax=Candidatus Liberibacter europaeus TaxID=744859 RepID=A0A2T4VYR7_9HYPH|nr:apolipoprotein N-acyltransferase [Candidatus Liberibacter europaeus]PTL86929.1 MAG: apolipoprotein N-acyltransferase [Candidatus Liberibacter europaeus]